MFTVYKAYRHNIVCLLLKLTCSSAVVDEPARRTASRLMANF